MINRNENGPYRLLFEVEETNICLDLSIQTINQKDLPCHTCVHLQQSPNTLPCKLVTVDTLSRGVVIKKPTIHRRFAWTNTLYAYIMTNRETDIEVVKVVHSPSRETCTIVNDHGQVVSVSFHITSILAVLYDFPRVDIYNFKLVDNKLESYILMNIELEVVPDDVMDLIWSNEPTMATLAVWTRKEILIFDANIEDRFVVKHKQLISAISNISKVCIDRVSKNIAIAYDNSCIETYGRMTIMINFTPNEKFEALTHSEIKHLLFIGINQGGHSTFVSIFSDSLEFFINPKLEIFSKIRFDSSPQFVVPCHNNSQFVSLIDNSTKTLILIILDNSCLIPLRIVAYPLPTHVIDYFIDEYNSSKNGVIDVYIIHEDGLEIIQVTLQEISPTLSRIKGSLSGNINNRFTKNYSAISDNVAENKKKQLTESDHGIYHQFDSPSNKNGSPYAELNILKISSEDSNTFSGSDMGEEEAEGDISQNSENIMYLREYIDRSLIIVTRQLEKTIHSEFNKLKVNGNEKTLNISKQVTDMEKRLKCLEDNIIFLVNKTKKGSSDITNQKSDSLLSSIKTSLDNLCSKMDHKKGHTVPDDLMNVKFFINKELQALLNKNFYKFNKNFEDILHKKIITDMKSEVIKIMDSLNLVFQNGTKQYLGSISDHLDSSKLAMLTELQKRNNDLIKEQIANSFIEIENKLKADLEASRNNLFLIKLNTENILQSIKAQPLHGKDICDDNTRVNNLISESKFSDALVICLKNWSNRILLENLLENAKPRILFSKTSSINLTKQFVVACSENLPDIDTNLLAEYLTEAMFILRMNLELLEVGFVQVIGNLRRQVYKAYQNSSLSPTALMLIKSMDSLSQDLE